MTSDAMPRCLCVKCKCLLKMQMLDQNAESAEIAEMQNARCKHANCHCKTQNTEMRFKTQASKARPAGPTKTKKDLSTDTILLAIYTYACLPPSIDSPGPNPRPRPSHIPSHIPSPSPSSLIRPVPAPSPFPVSIPIPVRSKSNGENGEQGCLHRHILTRRK